MATARVRPRTSAAGPYVLCGTGILPVMFMARTCPDAFDRDGHATLLVAATPHCVFEVRKQ